MADPYVFKAGLVDSGDGVEGGAPLGVLFSVLIVGSSTVFPGAVDAAS